MRMQAWWCSVGAFVLSGCPLTSSDEIATNDAGLDAGVEVVATTAQALVSTGGAPPTTYASSSPMPASLPSGKTGNDVDTLLMDGAFSLAVPPIPLQLPASGGSEPWIDTQLKAHPSAYSPALITRTQAALAAAETTLDTLATDWKKSLSVMEDIASLTGGDVTFWSPTDETAAYLPERARWLVSVTRSGKTTSYATPDAVSELRLRGSRLYCAAREAFVKARSNGVVPTKIMDARSVATLNLLGSKIAFMSVEPTISMAAPQKYLSTSNDGGQAFTVPLQVGARITPISLLPSLAEARTPVVIVTADGENRANTNVSSTGTSYDVWQTATHANAFLAKEQRAETTTQPVPLFTIGPVYGTLQLGLTVASDACSQGSNLSDCRDHPRRTPKRQMSIEGWPSARTKGRGNTMDGSMAYGMYNDGKWTPRVPGDWREFDLPGTAIDLGVSLTDPMVSRAAQNNDKSFEVRTSVTLSGTVRVTAGAELPGWMSIVARADGGLSGTGSVVHTIREQEEAVACTQQEPDGPFIGWCPETSLSVSPWLESTLALDTKVWMTVTLSNLPFVSSVQFDVTLLDVDTSIDVATSDYWDEPARLRLGTLQSINGKLDAANLKSHWPKGASFPARPDGLVACLADAAPTGTTGAPCGPIKPSYPSTIATGAPKRQLCFQAEDRVPDDLLFLGEGECRARMNTFVNSLPNREAGQLKDPTAADLVYVTTGVLDMANVSSWASNYKSMVDYCAGVIRDRTVLARVLKDSMVACDSSGKAYRVKDALKPTAGMSLSPQACTCSGSNCP
jgi:hypothetical protein